MATGTPHQPNPKRVLAGRLNRTKRKGLTPEGRERLRQTALKNQPWRFTRGPTTPEGKARAAQNCKVLRKGPQSLREIQAEVAELRSLVKQMRENRGVAVQATLACL